MLSRSGRPIDLTGHDAPAAPANGEVVVSWLMERIDDFLRGGEPPWQVQRGALISGLLEARREAVKSPGRWIKTPRLKTVR